MNKRQWILLSTLICVVIGIGIAVGLYMHKPSINDDSHSKGIVSKESSQVTKDKNLGQVVKKNKPDSTISKTLELLHSRETYNLEISKEQWLEDIDYLMTKVEKEHIDLYHNITREELNSKVNDLKGKLNDLGGTEIYFELCKLLANIGEGHTAIRSKVGGITYPIYYSGYDDGIYITTTSTEYEDVLGAKLRGINGHPIDTVIEGLSPYVSCDNEVNLRRKAIWLLNSVELLYYLSFIANTSEVELNIETLAGEQMDLIISAYPENTIKYNLVSIFYREDKVGEMFYRKNINKAYWFTYIEDKNALYFQYNKCENDTSNPLENVISDIIYRCNNNSIDKFILDMRLNGGGSSHLLLPLVEYLAQNDELNHRDKLFVVIGEATYSSAILDTLVMTNETEATLIGKPTGGRPNHYGQFVGFQLPHSKVIAMCSTKYFQYTEDDLPSIYPDVETPYLLQDLIEGKDRVMEYILNN